jgi:hypothetical protein
MEQMNNFGERVDQNRNTLWTHGTTKIDKERIRLRKQGEEEVTP